MPKQSAEQSKAAITALLKALLIEKSPSKSKMNLIEFNYSIAEL
jgi:hypothetical protein